MKYISRLFSLLIISFTILLFAVTAVWAFGGVDWEHKIITATGTGLSPQNTVNPVQARLLARRAAMVDAYRMLAESVKGVNVDAETTIENLVIQSDIVKTKVSACIKGAHVIAEREIPGGYEVTMELPMFGNSNPLAAAVLTRPSYQEPFPEPDESVEASDAVSLVNADVNVAAQLAAENILTPSQYNMTTSAFSTMDSMRAKLQPFTTGEAGTADALTDDSVGRNNRNAVPSIKKDNRLSKMFTGLVVDCRGLGLNAAMSPVIKNKKGESIYGHKNLDYDLVISKGMVAYSTDINSFERAGSNPLVVKAVTLENFNGNPVISVADANRVLIENKKTGFLDKMNVVFVK